MGAPPKHIKAGLGVTIGAGGGTHCAIAALLQYNIIISKPRVKNRCLKKLTVYDKGE
jgi:hypothetical protein